MLQVEIIQMNEPIKALETYRLLDVNNVEALVGASADYLEQNFSTVVTKAYGKDALIVHYGINSLSVSENERNRRIEQYRGLLLRLKEELPETRIIVSGVFPVSDRIYYNKGSFGYKMIAFLNMWQCSKS